MEYWSDGFGKAGNGAPSAPYDTFFPLRPLRLRVRYSDPFGCGSAALCRRGYLLYLKRF